VGGEAVGNGGDGATPPERISAPPVVLRPEPLASVETAGAAAPDFLAPGDATPAVAGLAPDEPVDQVAPVCPPEMVHVEGEYCTEVRHECRKWLDDPKLQYARCGEYEPSARCIGRRIRMAFCIDRYEYTPPGEKLPLNHQSFVLARKVCKTLGKRLCTEDEWNFACEGEEMLPYPYGFTREAKCNQDQDDLYEVKVINQKRKRVLRDLRASSGTYSDCTSPFGVHDMVGNLDEPVLREIARYSPPFRNGLKGGWWMAGRNRCRPATTAHDDYYSDIQVGVRCCSDVPGEVEASG